MFDLLTDWERVGNENARFYAAGVLLIIEYLHSHNIVYRDLKPENIFIDEEGYPKIFDFANSKVIENRTYSTVGTPHYMAPEVISGKGYGFSADYWSFGVLLYEILFNTLPFAPNAGDCYTIYQTILAHNLNFPAGNHLSRPLIEKLLTVNVTMRGNFKILKEHSWFIGISWDDYVAKQIPSPKKPKGIDLNKEITAKQNGKNELFMKISVRNS
jgi:cGMP-dependent protein kinase